jgi:hypothetical protein
MKARWLFGLAAWALVACSSNGGPGPLDDDEAPATGRKTKGAAKGTTSGAASDQLAAEPEEDPPPGMTDAGVDTTPPPPVVERPVSFVNVDYVEHDIRSFQGATESSCWDACRSEPNCVGFVMGTGADTGSCWLKATFALAITDARRSTFVRSSAALSHYRPDIGLDSPNNTISTMTSDAFACAKACSANPTCRGFVHTSDASNNCKLKSVISDTGQTCTGCTRFCDTAKAGCP